MLKITKRQRFILASILLLVISLPFNYLFTQFGYIIILGYVPIVYIINYFALREDISGIEYITLFVLPTIFFIGTNLFSTILPQRKLFLYPLYALLPLSMYITFLTENIFNVAAIRTIQLLRAAHAVSYIITLICLFFMLSWLISTHTTMWINILISVIFTFLLTLQFLWSFDLIPRLTFRTLSYSTIVCIVFTQILTIASFFPQSTAMTSLFLVAVYYVLLGLLQHYYENKLTRRPTVEYVIVAFIVFVIMLISTSWKG